MTPSAALCAVLVAACCTHAAATRVHAAQLPSVLVEAHCDNALRVRIAPPGTPVQNNSRLTD